MMDAYLQPIKVLRLLLKQLNIHFTTHTVNVFRNHPDYPSMLAFKHVLDRFGVENLAVKALSYEQLVEDFPKPLLVQLQNEGTMRYQIVAEADHEKIHLVGKDGVLRSLTKNEFLVDWDGISLLVDRESYIIKEENYPSNKLKERLQNLKWPFVALVFIGTLFRFLIVNRPYLLIDYVFISTKTLGLVISMLLVARSFSKDHPLIKKICGHSASKGASGCAGVLDSPQANLFGIVSWAEIGAWYFLSFLIYLLVFPNSSVLLPATASLLAFSFIIYSVYYQWKIVNQWCRLCLLVQAVLLLECCISAGYFYTTGHLQFPPALPEIIDCSLSFGLVAAVYVAIKPLAIDQKNDREQVRQLKKIKFDETVFEALLKKEKPVELEGIGPVRLGNLEGQHQMIVINNPTCPPCIHLHQQLLDLLKTKKNLGITEVFLVPQNDQSMSYKLAKTMLRMDRENPHELTMAMGEYYHQHAQNPQEWLQKYASPGDGDIGKALADHFQWCRKNALTATPLLFYNGYPLPDAYSVGDLEYLVD